MPKLSNGGSCWCVFNCVKNLANLKIYISITALQEKSFTAVLLQMLILIYIFKDWSRPFKVPNLQPALEISDELLSFTPMPIFQFLQMRWTLSNCKYTIVKQLWQIQDVFYNKQTFQSISWRCSLASQLFPPSHYLKHKSFLECNYWKKH